MGEATVKRRRLNGLGTLMRFLFPLLILLALFNRVTVGGYLNFDVINEISQVKSTLSQVGPALSATLFVIAGIFYAIGQLLPPDKKANFHTTAINIIIGAIVIGVLSMASDTLALASTHLLSNITTTIA